MFLVSFVTDILFGSGVGDLVLDLLFTGDRDRFRSPRPPGGDRRLTGDRDRFRIIGDRDRRRGGDPPPRLMGDLERLLGDIDLLGRRLNDGDRRLLGDGDRRRGDRRRGDGLLLRPRGDGLRRPPLPRGDGDRLPLTGERRLSLPPPPPLRRSTGDLEDPDEDDELDDDEEEEEELKYNFKVY